jgi:hypothetical protein
MTNVLPGLRMEGLPARCPSSQVRADRSTGLRRRVVDLRGARADDQAMAEYALVTAVVASLALSLAAIPEGQLSRKLPVTAARAQGLLATSAGAGKVSVSESRRVMARAPYGRVALRYLYAEGWIAGRRNAAECVFAKATPASTETRVRAAIAKDSRLRARLRRMQVTVPQAASAITRGTGAAC